MENLLTCLINDCRAMGSGNNLNCKTIQELSKDALDLLETQTGLLQTPPFELREKCFAVLKAAVLSSSGHLLRLGLIGCHKLLRDNHLISTNCDPLDDSLWLASQLLKTLKCRSWQKASEDIQIEVCRILLSFSCLDRNYYKLNARTLVDLLNFCIDLVVDQAGSACKYRRLHVASRNAAVKNIQSFASYYSGRKQVGELVPIVQFLCDKFHDSLSDSQFLFVREFCLECICSLLKQLNENAGDCSRLHNVVWRKLCPVLTEVIGIPPEPQPLNVDNKIVEFRLISGIACELLGLFGSISALRPPIESLFHRILVVANRSQKMEAFKTLKEVFQNPRRVLATAGPFLVESADILASLPTDLGLTRILFDAMEESVQQDDPQLRRVILELVKALLHSLVALTGASSGDHISDEYAAKINSLYADVCSADYIGVLSLPSKLRMPKTYEQLLEDRRAVLTKLEETKVETCVPCRAGEVDNDDLQSTTSGVTEGPEPFATISDDEEDFELQERMKLFPYNPELMVRADQADVERSAAKKFLQDFRDFLRQLPSVRSPLEVDVALQGFASSYCSSHFNFLYNADGIYLAAYSALLLNYELIQKNFYSEPTKSVPQSEEEFVNGILNSGMLVYLTTDFLSEVYQGILVSNVLQEAGLCRGTKSLRSILSNNSLANLLTDIRYLKSSESATCFLSDCRKLYFASAPNVLHNDAKRSAGRKFTRRLLTCVWDSLLSILSSGISSSDSSIVSVSLEGLESAAKLANVVSMQERCGTIFALLAAVACGSPRIPSLMQRKVRRMSVMSRKSVIDLDVTHVMSLNVILSKGLELASFNQEAWTHVLRCCLHVADLERQLYKSKTSDTSKMATLKQYTTKLSSALSSAKTNADYLNFTATAFGGLEEESADSYSFLTAASRLPANENEEQVIKDILSGAGGNVSLLDTAVASRVIASLSDRVSSLLEDAAAKLNLQSLLLLLNELCHVCRVQLSRLNDDSVTVQCVWILHRIGEVMTRSVKTGRPLYHALHCWAVIGPALLQAASSSDPTVSKTAVEILHSVISQVLQEQPEPAHFHFNEALFKPFENLLSFQLCDRDTQDQVTSSLCELVECWSAEIKSGWRSLFACLRRYPRDKEVVADRESSDSTLQTVKDIFTAFFQHSTSQPLIFANAAQDAILCLLHFVKSSKNPDLGILALSYLDQCSEILVKLLQNPDIPVFHSALRLYFSITEPVYEPPIIDLHHSEHQQWEKAVRSLYLMEDALDASTLENNDGLRKVLYLLIEGVACNLCFESPLQRNACQVVMATVERIIQAGREDFAELCLRSIVIPSMVSWQEQLSAESSGNFKLACGLLCDAATRLKNPHSCRTLFARLFVLLVKCAVEPNETLARIGNSCLRHLAAFCADNRDLVGDAIWASLMAALTIILLRNIDLLQRSLLSSSDTSGSSSDSSASLLSLQLCLNTVGAVVLQANFALPNARNVLGHLLLVETSSAKLKLGSADLENTLLYICRLCSEFAMDAEFAVATISDSAPHDGQLYTALLPTLRGLTALSCSLYLICCLNLTSNDNTERALTDWLEFLTQFYTESCERCVGPRTGADFRKPGSMESFQYDLSKELLVTALHLLGSASENQPLPATRTVASFFKNLDISHDENVSSQVLSLKKLYKCA